MFPSDLTWTFAVVGGIHYLLGTMFVIGAARIAIRGKVGFLIRWPGSLPAESTEDLGKWSDLKVTDRIGAMAVAVLYLGAGAYLLFQLGASIPVFLEEPHTWADWICITTFFVVLSAAILWLQGARISRRKPTSPPRRSGYEA